LLLSNVIRFKQLLRLEISPSTYGILKPGVAFLADAVQKFHSTIAINSRIFISTTTKTMRPPSVWFDVQV